MPAPPKFKDSDAAKFLQRGYAAVQARAFQDAGACAQLVLKYRPRHMGAHFLVGLIGAETGEWAVAIKAFKNIVALDDSHAAAWAQLARAYATTGNYELAESAAEKAQATIKDDPLVMDVLGTVHSLLGDQEKALAWYSKAFALQGSGQFALGRAKALTFLGRLPEAKQALDLALQDMPLNGQAHWMLSRLQKADCETHIEAMESLLANPQCPAVSKPFLHYACGKEYEDLGAWDAAFRAYAAGAAVRRRELRFDEKGEKALFQALESLCDDRWLDRAGEGYETDAPIFIVGQPRTGSTLIERVITAHSDVTSAGELQQFSFAVRRAANDMLAAGKTRQMRDGGGASMSLSNAGLIGGLNAGTLEAAIKAPVAAMGAAYMQTTRMMQGNTRHFVDKMPVNFLFVPFIAAALPGAKIVHVSRDPVDACFASFKQLFADAYFHSYDLEEMARHHVRYHRLMAHWRALLGERLIEVAYEDMVTNFESQSRALIAALGLPWQDASLHFEVQDTAVTTASSVQVREKAHSRSVGRWRHFEHHLKPMIDILDKAGLV